MRLRLCACFYIPPHIVFFKTCRLKKHDARRDGMGDSRAY